MVFNPFDGAAADTSFIDGIELVVLGLIPGTLASVVATAVPFLVLDHFVQKRPHFVSSIFVGVLLAEWAFQVWIAIANAVVGDPFIALWPVNPTVNAMAIIAGVGAGLVYWLMTGRKPIAEQQQQAETH